MSLLLLSLCIVLLLFLFSCSLLSSLLFLVLQHFFVWLSHSVLLVIARGFIVFAVSVWFSFMFLFELHVFALARIILCSSLRFCLVSLFCDTAQMRRNQNVKKREHDKDMMQVAHQKMFKKGQVSPHPPCCRGSKQIVWEVVVLKHTNLKSMKDNMLRASLYSVFANFSYKIFGTCSPAIHVRVSPLSTFFPSHVSCNVDSGIGG